MLKFRKFLGYFVLQILLLVINFTTDCKGINRKVDCPAPPVFSNGGTSKKKKLIMYICHKGFELEGQRYARCVRGSWDSPPPVCIRPGCPKINAPKNGVHVFTRKNAAVTFFCDPGYAMIGSGFAYCNGSAWNGTTPECESSASRIPAKSCDFESADLCGWTHDPYHDFDWRRQNRNTPSGHLRTGPSYDHTFGYGKDGYYMYIESTSRLENDTARLISPVYPASLSQAGCFIFSYHMYGRTTGSLRVLMVPVTVELAAIVNDAVLRSRYTMFVESGNQGNAWYGGFFDLDVTQDNFQIVIEGVRGSGYVSDIAIDDVFILEAEQCAQKRVEHVTAGAIPAITRDSCLNRCDQTINSTGGGEDVDCACTEDCVSLETCCVDYTDICVFSVTDSPVDTPKPATQESSVEDASSVPPPLPPALKMTATNAPNNTDTHKESGPTLITEKSTKKDVITTKPSMVVTATKKQITAKPATNAKPAATQKPTTFAFATTKPISTTAKQINVPVIKTVKTTQLTSDQKSNATGIPNHPPNADPQNTTLRTITKESTAPKKNDEPIKNFTINLDRYVAEVFNVTKSRVSAVTSKTIGKGQTNGYSKTFDHYSVLPPGYAGEGGSGPRNAAIKENVTSLANDAALRIIQGADSHTADAPATSWGLIVAMTLLAIGCSAGAIFLVRSGRFRTLLDRGRMRMRLDAGSSSNADMRFLVQDEELEHDYED